MRYEILQNYIGQDGHFMCYYLVDTQEKDPDASIKAGFRHGGYKLVKWSYNGKKLYDMQQKLNKK